MSIINGLKRLLKVDPVAHTNEANKQLREVRVKLAELEASQAPLKRAVEDTGFFLGDALVRQSNDRNRAIHHNH